MSKSGRGSFIHARENRRKCVVHQQNEIECCVDMQNPNIMSWGLAYLEESIVEYDEGESDEGRCPAPSKTNEI
jgi:hypothetical protein